MIAIDVKYTGSIRFPFRIKDVRVNRKPYGRVWLCEYEKGYDTAISIVPVFKYCVNRMTISDDNKTANYYWCVLLRFWFWTIEICNGQFSKPFQLPWMEDSKHKYLMSYEELQKEPIK